MRMNVSKIGNANAAKIYSEVNKKISLDRTEKNEQKVKSGDLLPEKDHVSISREAKSMNVLDFAKERIKADMSKDVPADKISRLKNAVKSGSYKIDAESLVSAVIDGRPQA